MARNALYIEGKPTKVKVNKAGDSKVVNFTLAYYNGPNAEKPGYIQVEFWNSTPEQRKALKKIEGEGRVAVAGLLKQDFWENDDGPNYVTKIRADSVSIAFDPPERDDDDDDDKSNRRRQKKGSSKKKDSSKKKKGDSKKKSSKKRRRKEDDDWDDDDDENEDDDNDDNDDDDDDEDEDVPF